MVRIGRSMCSRPQYTDLTCMGGTGPCELMKIIFGSVIRSWYISIDIKFWVNRKFHVLKTPVYRFCLYGKYQDDYYYDQDDYRYSPFSIPSGLWLMKTYFAKFEVCRFLRSGASVITTDGWTDWRIDRHMSNVLEFRADQKSPRNQGFQINISMRHSCIDKTIIHSMRRVLKMVRYWRIKFCKIFEKHVMPNYFYALDRVGFRIILLFKRIHFSNKPIPDVFYINVGQIWCLPRLYVCGESEHYRI